MRAARLAAMVTALVALASWSAQAQVFEAKVRGKRLETDDDGENYRGHRFDEEDIFDYLEAPEGSRLVMEYFGEGDQWVYVVDQNGNFWDWFMYDLGSSCAEGARETQTSFTRREFCVELISLFDTDVINGAATCRITSKFTEDRDTLRKRCHIEAIDPSTGWPVEFTLSGGRDAELGPLE